MDRAHGKLLTLEELGARVAVALSADYIGSSSGRVRDVPDIRTIRYYTTLGLIDRPAEMRGRTALYGRRHLLQLVAIKRLQAHGQTLAEIQSQLVGQTDSALARVARVPDDRAAEPPQESTPNSRADAFWTDHVPDISPAAPPTPNAAAPIPMQGITLEDGVVLLLTPARPVVDEDIAALRAAAAPLLKVLARRRLSRPRSERKSS